MLQIVERRILRTEENGMWRSKYKHELYKLRNEPDIVKVMKVGQLRWLRHLFRMQDQNPCRKVTLQNQRILDE
jgi:hypothetical protein